MGVWKCCRKFQGVVTLLTKHAQPNSIPYVKAYKLHLELRQYWMRRSERSIIKSQKIKKKKF